VKKEPLEYSQIVSGGTYRLKEFRKAIRAAGFIRENWATYYRGDAIKPETWTFVDEYAFHHIEGSNEADMQVTLLENE